MVARAPAGSGSTPVVICGGGPVGLALALELDHQGVDSVVIEPRLAPTRARPRAKTLNTRTLEHLRRWGLVAELRARAPLAVDWSQDVSFATTLLGDEIARFEGVLGLRQHGLSPELGQQLPQYVLETFLRERVAASPRAELRLGHRVTGLSQNDDGVVVTTTRADGSAEQITGQYLVGADGGRSLVREQVGAHYLGTAALRPNTGIVFRCPELAGRLTHPPAVQTWLLNESVPGLIGPIDQTGTWWLIAFGVDGTAADLDPSALVRGAVGADVTVEIVSTDPWTARMELVDCARVGRVFLIGDAAHLNPPFGGHGLNTGIGDAVDLGWKLAAVIQGWGGPALLASHEAERRPLQQRIIDEATTNNAVLSNELLSGSREEIAQRIGALKSVEYFSIALVLGHRYVDSPVLVDGSSTSGDHWAGGATAGRRIPHVWTEPGVSTLDLAGPGYALLAAPSTDLGALTDAAEQVGLPFTEQRVSPDVMAVLGAEVVALRPDQIVGWAGPATVTDPLPIVRVLAGEAGPM